MGLIFGAIGDTMKAQLKQERDRVGRERSEVNMNDNDIRQAARDYCAAHDLSQEALARKIGASRHAVRWFLWQEPYRPLAPAPLAALIMLMLRDMGETTTARRRRGRPCARRRTA